MRSFQSCNKVSLKQRIQTSTCQLFVMVGGMNISLHVGGGWGLLMRASVAGQRNIASQCPRNTLSGTVCLTSRDIDTLLMDVLWKRGWYQRIINRVSWAGLLDQKIITDVILYRSHDTLWYLFYGDIYVGCGEFLGKYWGTMGKFLWRICSAKILDVNILGEETYYVIDMTWADKRSVWEKIRYNLGNFLGNYGKLRGNLFMLTCRYSMS